jgi:hypothetical protein
MGNKGSKEGGQKIKVKDKIPSESPLGKMLRYWDDSPLIKGEKNGQILLFYLDPRTDLKAFGFLAKNMGLMRTGSATINSTCKQQEPSHSRGDGICPLLETESQSPVSIREKRKRKKNKKTLNF